MKVSRNWLQTFFQEALPSPAVLADALTFHSSEIEEMTEKDGDSVLDIKVLPDKASWLLSHRGIAKELATILTLRVSDDPFAHTPLLTPATPTLQVFLNTPDCTRYAAAHIEGVSVGDSPPWLRQRLEAIGQRPINNVVDATNYVMFHLGQPLHAFDAGKLAVADDTYRIGVRSAKEGEKIVTLTGDECTLTPADMLIIDAGNDAPIGIAGVKGGAHAAVSASTTSIIIESANFDRVAIRRTSQRLKLRTDASVRYENGVVPELVPYGLAAVVALIADIAGGTVRGYTDVFPSPRTITPVSLPLEKCNRVLGLSLTETDVQSLIARFGYEASVQDGVLTVLPPFERTDLIIPEDLIEEIGRVYGLAHIPSVLPPAVPLTEYNKRFFYAESVREALVVAGFSEVYTSSFRAQDVVKLENALAADKGYLRSTLSENMAEALTRNEHTIDLLGIPHSALFEIGAIFPGDGEYVSLACGVRTGHGYHAAMDDPLLHEALRIINTTLGVEGAYRVEEGIAEVNFDTLIAPLPMPHAYATHPAQSDTAYKPFSLYPFITRDIAMWVPEETTVADIETALTHAAGELLARLTLFDEYKKDARVSYAFRLVFQSSDRTLTNEEVNVIMETVVLEVKGKGWEVR